MNRTIVLITALLFGIFITSAPSNISRNLYYEYEISDSILYDALIHYEVKYPRSVLAQAKLESGNYTSYVYRTKNNFLGLYNSRKKDYYEFEHWTQCIIAYKKLVEYKLKEGENYHDFLERIGYAEDPAYVDKVKAIESNLKI